MTNNAHPAPSPTILAELWKETPPAIAVTKTLHRMLWALTAVFGVTLVLAATVPIDGAVIGTGRIILQNRVKTLAHPTGGVIGTIAVRNGDRVRAGQILLRLDDRVTSADARYSDETVEQLLAQKARAEAEQWGRSTIAFPIALADSTAPAAMNAMADARRLLALHRAETAAIAGQIAARIAQDLAAIRGFAAQIDAQREQRRLIEQERQGVRDLWERRLVTISRVNQLERGVVEYSGSIAALQAQIAQTRARMTEAHVQALQLLQNRQIAASNDLIQINAALGQQQLRRTSANDLYDRSVVRAPCDGTVEKLVVTTTGDVIRPAEPIMDIVPDHDTMVVEAMISPADIGHVHKSDRASVRLPGLNRATTPEWTGRVITVATDRSETIEPKQAWYVVQIMLDRGGPDHNTADLKSGMPAEVHIASGPRTLLSYLSKPLRDQFARAFREP